MGITSGVMAAIFHLFVLFWFVCSGISPGSKSHWSSQWLRLAINNRPDWHWYGIVIKSLEKGDS